VINECDCGGFDGETDARSSASTDGLLPVDKVDEVVSLLFLCLIVLCAGLVPLTGRGRGRAVSESSASLSIDPRADLGRRSVANAVSSCVRTLN
jgi:hypothetical protein